MCRGFLLLEAMIASVVFSVAVVAIAMLLITANEEAVILRQNSTATALAQQLLEEIAAKPLYPPPGTSLPSSTPSSRSQYIAALQYSGYTDSTAALSTIDGEPVTVGGGLLYTRTVAESAWTVESGATGDLVLITVTVTTPAGRQIALSRLMARADYKT